MFANVHQCLYVCTSYIYSSLHISDKGHLHVFQIVWYWSSACCFVHVCSVIKSWTSTRYTIASINSDKFFPSHEVWTWYSSKQKLYFHIFSCSPALLLMCVCVCFPSFGSIRTDLQCIFFVIAYLPNPVIPRGRRVTILAVTGLAAALGVSWSTSVHPRWTRRSGLLEIPRKSVSSFLLANKIDYEQGKAHESSMHPCESRYIYIYM